MKGWVERSPGSIPAQWLRGELPVEDAIRLGSADPEWTVRFWTTQVLVPAHRTSMVMTPADLVRVLAAAAF